MKQLLGCSSWLLGGFLLLKYASDLPLVLGTSFNISLWNVIIHHVKTSGGTNRNVIIMLIIIINVSNIVILCILCTLVWSNDYLGSVLVSINVTVIGCQNL